MNLIKTDVFRFMNACHTDFDVIFADPPYELEKLSLIPDAIFGQDLLRDNGILILEHGKKHDFSEHPHFSFHRNYGNVNFTFFENKPNWPE